MRILLLGKNGQVGRELQRTLAPLGDVTALGRAELDLADLDSIGRVVHASRPEVIVNAAAYTAVDKAESERELAFAVNATAVERLALAAAESGALLVHYSTDYVFDGSLERPYREHDATNPVSVYGASKLGGELAIGKSGCRHLILRTSWVYGLRGSNFFRTIARLAREQPQLRVIDDQFGAPTSCGAIARATARVLRAPATTDGAFHGVVHMTAGGETTWHGFAEAIVALEGLTTPVLAIRTEDYPTAARRPRNSRLDNSLLRSTFGVALPDWRDGLAELGRERAAS